MANFSLHGFNRAQAHAGIPITSLVAEVPGDIVPAVIFSGIYIFDGVISESEWDTYLVDEFSDARFSPPFGLDPVLPTILNPPPAPQNRLWSVRVFISTEVNEDGDFVYNTYNWLADTGQSGQFTFPSGLYNSDFKFVLFLLTGFRTTLVGEWGAELQITSGSAVNDPLFWTGTDGPNTPDSPTVDSDEWDSDVDQQVVQFSFQQPDPDNNPDGYYVTATNIDTAELVIFTGVEAGAPGETLTAILNFPPDPSGAGAGVSTAFIINIIPYRLTPGEEPTQGEPSPNVIYTVNLPNIATSGNSGLNVGGSATLVLIANPSGLYTLIPTKTNDTLYERSGSITTQVVKIPDPFAKTAFIGQ